MVRAVLAGIAQLLELDPELFDDLKTAVSEACNNVVLHAYDGSSGPFQVTLVIGADGIEAKIRDWGRGIHQVGSSEEWMGVGLAVISALADRAEFIRAPDGGTEVRMSFADPNAPIRTLELPSDGDGTAQVPVELSGDVMVAVRPVALLPGVLGRLARAVAARTHLSLDRFSDIYLVTDAIAAFAGSAAGASDIAFAVTASHKRLELTVGPFRPGQGGRLVESGLLDESGSPLRAVLSEFAFEPGDGFELLRVVVEEG